MAYRSATVSLKYLSYTPVDSHLLPHVHRPNAPAVICTCLCVCGNFHHCVPLKIKAEFKVAALLYV